MATAIKSLVSAEHVYRVGEGETWEKISSGRQPIHVLLFTEKTEATLLYKSLSWKYHKYASFYEIHSSNRQLIEAFKIDHFPTLLILKGEARIQYSGELNGLALAHFLDEKLEVPPSVVEVETQLRFLQSTDLEKIDKDEEIWLIAFFADPQGTRCMQSVTEFDEVVKRLREMVRIGFYNLTANPEHEDLEDMGINPTAMAAQPCKMKIVRFPFGVRKNEIDDYEMYKGDLDPKKLQSFALEANEIHPLKLDAPSLTLFMGVPEGTTPRPKIVLFSSHEACPSLYAALAMSLRHWKADFAFVPPTEAKLREQFQIKSLPTLSLVYFDPTADEGKQVLAPQYPGPLRFGSMKGWIEALLITLKTGRTEVHDPFFVPEEKKEVPRIETDAEVSAMCNTSVPLCVFAVLNHEDSKFQSHMEWLETLVLQKSQETSPFRFGWLEGGDAPNFIATFGVGKGDAPTLIVLSPKKRRYATLKRQTGTKEVEAFLRSVMRGQEQTFPCEEIPKLRIEEVVVELVEEIDLEELEDVEVGKSNERKEEL